MTPSFIRRTVAGFGLLFASPPLLAQAPSIGTWSGTIKRAGADAQPFVARIREQPGLQSLTLELTSGANRKGIAVSEIQFNGVSATFRAAIGDRADCKLDAIAARGYAGSCVTPSGDSIQMTLVPPRPGMLLADHEIRVAREAGPPDVAAAATVYVFGERGYWEAVRGTNGFVCYIRRPTLNDSWPICNNRESANLVTVENYRMQLRSAGVSEPGIADSVERAYQQGRYRAPATGAMGYMLSPAAWTFNVAGQRQVFLGPHLHFYTPFATNPMVGIDPEKPVVAMRLEFGGTAEASVIVPAPLRKTAGH